MDVEAFKAEINAVCSKYGLWLLAPVHTSRISIVTHDYKCIERDVQFKPPPAFIETPATVTIERVSQSVIKCQFGDRRWFVFFRCKEWPRHGFNVTEATDTWTPHYPNLVGPVFASADEAVEYIKSLCGLPSLYGVLRDT